MKWLTAVRLLNAVPGISEVPTSVCIMVSKYGRAKAHLCNFLRALEPTIEGNEKEG